MKPVALPVALMVAASLAAWPPAASAKSPAKPAAVTSPAKPGPAAPAADAVPTKITSERMLYSHAGQSVTFEGSVFVDRPDFQLWAQRITVFFAGRPEAKEAARSEAGPEQALAGQAENIDRIEAQGDVRMKRENRTGKCEKAVYHAKESLVVMSGSPVLMDGANKIQGEVIKFWLKDNRSEVVGGPGGRVEALFFTAKGPKAP